jgi:formylglycine-generating enzyme required for sulfatase activity
MLGNVWEWCEDGYHENYDGAPTNGSARSPVGKEAYRVIRGGAFDTELVREAARLFAPSSTKDNNKGFRVVAVPRVQ